jgi:serine/threonine protein kinase
VVQEARAAGRLRHPNIVTIFDAGEDRGRSFIVMEYVPGETLRAVIQSRAPLPLTRRLEYIEGACAGLAHAHRSGVVHLDIKPDNLMLDESGVVKVLDFGIARVLQGDSTATHHLAGTLRYMSPEQVSGGRLDGRSDVFSLGCSLFELVAYTPAYDGSAHEIIMRLTGGPVPSLLDVMPDVDRRLAAIAQRAMALDPLDRYDDLDDLRVDLGRLREEIADSGDVRSPSVALVSNKRPSSRRSRLTVSIVSAVALAAGAAVFGIYGTSGLSEGPGPREPISTVGPSESARLQSTPPGQIDSTEEIWRRLAAGNRQGVLQLLQSSAGNRDAGADARLAAKVIETVRAAALQSRQAAVSRSSESYRSGEDQLALASRLEKDGRPLDALRALWQAADLYRQPPANVEVQPSGDTSDPPTIPVDRTLTAHGTGQPSPRSDEPAAPEPASGASTDVTSTARAASTEPDPPKPLADSDAILDVLRQYRGAYEALDISGVLRVFPSLGRDQVEQLRRTFEGMSAYDLEIRNPRVEMRGDSAVAFATVARRMVPRVGRPVINQVETEFRLRRDGGSWVITAVTAPKG